MKQEYTQTLQKIGLAESEAKVYLANLEIGPSSIIKIAQKSGLTRQTVYTLMPKLVEAGLIKEITNGIKRHFEATNPDTLKDRVLAISSQIDELVPELKSRQATNAAIPLITVYENPAAMRDWYRHFMAEIEDGDDFLVWSAGKDWYEMDREFYQKFIDYKATKKIKNYVIGQNSPDSRKLLENINGPIDSFEYRISDENWNTNVDKWIWRDEICFQTLRENATNLIVIKSVDLAAIERFNFYRVWNQLESSK